MPRYGFIRTKEEIKFLALYAMDFLPFPVSFEAVVDITTWCDGGFGFFELKEAFDEMLHTGHICEQAPACYAITDKGREAAEIFAGQLPHSVREAAQRSALRVVQQIRRDAAISTSVRTLAEHDLLVNMDMEGVFSLQMHVVSQAQATLLERTFQKNAEKIYDVLLDAVTREYPEEGST